MGPAIDHCSAAGLQGAVNFLGPIETRARGEEDGDIGERVRECGLWEVQCLTFLQRCMQRPVVLLGGMRKRGQEWWVDVGGMDLERGWWVWGGGRRSRDTVPEPQALSWMTAPSWMGGIRVRLCDANWTVTRPPVAS